jgi:DNA repair protein SbcD/Mre11
VHNRQVLCTDPYIVYPGNIQGRHGKEQGEKGCELVTVSEAGVISIRTIFTSVLPWREIDVDVSDCCTADEVYDKVRLQIGTVIPPNDDRVSALRVRISGTTDAHSLINQNLENARAEVISIANECGNGGLWIERVQVATYPKLDKAMLLQRDDPIGEVLRTIAAIRADVPSLAKCESVAELQAKLPSEHMEGSEPVTIDDLALNKALDEAEALLLARLAATETL